MRPKKKGTSRRSSDLADLSRIVPIYAYRGVHANGRATKGSVTADSERTARSRMRAEGVFLTEITESQADASRAAKSAVGSGGRFDFNFSRPIPSMERAIATMRVIWSSNLWVGLNLRYQALGRETDGSDVERITWLLAQEGRAKSATDYARALQIIHKTGRDFAAFFETYDVALTPTMAQPPWPFGIIDMMGDDLEAYFDTLFSHMPATAQYNMTGQPAASVPLYWNDAGLPIGVQFAGRFGDEATLFKLSAPLEQARPWAERKPALD